MEHRCSQVLARLWNMNVSSQKCCGRLFSRSPGAASSGWADCLSVLWEHLSPAQPAASTFQTQSLPGCLDSGECGSTPHLSSSYVNTEDSPLVHSLYQNPVVCGCAGLGERPSCATLRKMAMLTGLVPRPYLMGAVQIEGDRCGYYLNALFLGTRQMATEPRLQEATEEGKPQGGIKALEVVAPLAARKCAPYM